MDELINRCKTICGDDRSGCFISNASHLECITDIVINKIWAAREIVALGAGEVTSGMTAGALKRATDEMDELILWVQRLQALRRKKDGEEQEETLCKG